MIAKVKRMATPPETDAAWDDPPWRNIPAERLQNYMGEKPVHFPKTEVKIAWEKTALHLLFRVEDRYVRAIAANHQDSVCGDSCVEFFFTPGYDLSSGYFNIEMNCGGTMLFHFHPESRKEGVEIPRTDCEKIIKSHSLPHMVNPEVQEPVTWIVACSLSTTLLERYCPVSAPSPHARWRANFYKCADQSSHPHWLTWSPVDYPKPHFHLPQSFGTLEFE